MVEQRFRYRKLSPYTVVLLCISGYLLWPRASARLVPQRFDSLDYIGAFVGVLGLVAVAWLITRSCLGGVSLSDQELTSFDAVGRPTRIPFESVSAVEYSERATIPFKYRSVSVSWTGGKHKVDGELVNFAQFVSALRERTTHAFWIEKREMG